MNEDDHWEEMLSDDGRIFYYNTVTGKSTWTNPIAQTDEAKCWRKSKAANGTTFFYNSMTKATSWARPEEYDQKIEREQEIETKRENFFKMMSSSIPKDLDVKQNPTPAPFTIKDVSSRFDTDPRLITATEKERERFMDEWLILERKRRAYLERRLVLNAKARLKEKLEDMFSNGTFNVSTKWEEIIGSFRLNKDWRLLLNYDRLEVFQEVKRSVHQRFMEARNSADEEKQRVEATRRNNFMRMMHEILDEYSGSLDGLCYWQLKDQIESRPEYAELCRNERGSTPVDLFFAAVDERRQAGMR